jgi:hypothetical protein
MGLQNQPNLDDRLRPLFERLRESEAAHVPPLAHVLERALGVPHLVPTRVCLRRLSAVSAGLALVLVATCWLTPTRVPEQQVASVDVALLYWRSPTETLLTSQRDCLSDAYADALAAVSRGKAEGR